MVDQKRCQTTKGNWMCQARDMPVLAMDMEGADGPERIEDRSFEREAALFSTATSGVIIFNLW